MHQSGDAVAKKGEIPDDLHAPVMWDYMFGRKVTQEEMFDLINRFK